MSYYIAIDGGGTKTEALLCTERGDILARAVGGATNPNDIGCDESGKRLHDIMRGKLSRYTFDSEWSQLAKAKKEVRSLACLQKY